MNWRMAETSAADSSPRGSRQAETPPPRASSGKTSERLAAWVGSILFPLTLYIAGFLVFFRWQIFSDFDLVFGDAGDTRLAAFLHEHIFRWLYVRSGFLSPPFFFDQAGTLGYSDAFLLDQILYAPLRLLGAEPLLAISLIAVILSGVGYLFFYLFLRRLDVSVPLASLAAFIFTFANNLYLKSGHFQHFTVYYIPIVAYCGLLAVSEVHQRPIRAYLLGAFAAGLYGVLFSNGYYMAWFFGLGLLISTPIAVYIAWPLVHAWWSKHPTRVLGLGLVASLSFVATLSIFIVIYAPVLATGVGRDFREYLYYAPTPVDILNVGSQNLVWSGLIRWLHLIRDDRLGNGEISIALTPVVQILLASSVVLAFRQTFWPADNAGRISRAFVIAGASVCVLFYLLTVKTHNHSLFRILHDVVPGAKAIRVGYRGMVVANLFAVTAIGLTFNQIIRLLLLESRPLMRFGWLAPLTALLALAATEQVNLAQAASLSRKVEREHLNALGRAPRECRTFYVAAQPKRTLGYGQVDGMMVALAQHLPTINGHSGLFPPGWDLYDGNAPDYEQRAMRWALKRGIAEGLCRADVDKGTWTVVPMDRDWICVAGPCVRRILFGQSHEFEINLKLDGNGASFIDDRWSGAEPWGQWTNATQAALLFSVGTPRNLSFELSIRALLSRSAPKQTVWVEANHCRVRSTEFDLAHGSRPQTISGTIPATCIDADGKVVLRFNTDRARSPMELGISGDSRQLGVGVEHVVIRESNQN